MGRGHARRSRRSSTIRRSRGSASVCSISRSARTPATTRASSSPPSPIAPLPGNAANIKASLAAQMPAGDTPTLPALRGAIEYARAARIGDPTSRVLVALATDGAPDACDSTTEAVASRSRRRGEHRSSSAHLRDWARDGLFERARQDRGGGRHGRAYRDWKGRDHGAEVRRCIEVGARRRRVRASSRCRRPARDRRHRRISRSPMGSGPALEPR